MSTSTPKNFLILFLGPSWWGSDARAMAAGFRLLGHSLVEVDYEDYFPLQWSTLSLRLLRRAIRRLCEVNYNRVICQHLANKALDFVFVFKGMLLAPETLAKFSKQGVPKYCFYPDISFFDHGNNIWSCLPLYDCLFTTKSFHLSDQRIQARVQEVRFVAHGYDPDLHRPALKSDSVIEQYACDVSFVGCWSPQKEKLLSELIQQCRQRDLRIWGPGWERAKSAVRKRWQNRGAYGDELVLIYCNSKINLGLLSEAGGGTIVGDQTTARTWQIPGCGCFMLHEYTEELAQYFSPGTEVAVFRSLKDLVEKVEYYLNHDDEREAITLAGHHRSQIAGYNYNKAAEEVVRYHSERL
jgi:hypothetical protein